MMHYKPTDTWATIFPDEQLIHLHFGTSTHNDKESTAETTWVYENLTKKVEAEYPDTLFFTISDVSRADDSESPSSETKRLYKKMLGHPQNAALVFYGASTGMNFLLQMIRHLTGIGSKLKSVESLGEAETLHKKWLEKQQSK